MQRTDENQNQNQNHDTTQTAMTKDEAPFEHEQDSSRTHRQDDEAINVSVQAEELTATRREVDRGAVTVEKDVVEEERTLDVPVTEERVTVQRRAVDREAPVDDSSFEGGSIEVPVTGQEVDVQKRARVTEEVEIGKEAVGRTERVSDTVRHEEVRVEDTTAGVTDVGRSDRGR